MKPIQSDTTVVSNITGEKIAMKLDENSTVHLMSLFTDLYSDPKMAIVREYSTNALDSHIDAGVTRPIEITTPSGLRPFFTVKDFGIGMDEESIRNTYSLYGASTKRETNEQIGALGLGGKSALTYTSQFSVIGVKDGIRTVVSISRDEDGAGSMTIVEKTATDEPNGVEVMIPTKRGDDLQKETRNFFRFWKDGTVLINGEEPEKVSGLHISDTIQLVKREGYNDNTTGVVVMGGVAYPIPAEYKPTSNHSTYYMVAEVEIGDISFTPSREALQLTKATKARLELLKQEFQEQARAAVEKDIAKAKTPWEALVLFKNWKHALSTEALNIRYNGKAIPDGVWAPGAIPPPTGRAAWAATGDKATITNTESWRPGENHKTAFIDAAILEESVFISGFAIKFTAAHKRKIQKYFEEKNISARTVVLSDTPFVSEWIDPSKQLVWGPISEIKIPVKAGSGVAGKVLAGSYEAWDGKNHVSNTELEAENIDTSKPVAYFTNDMFNGQLHFSQFVNTLVTIDKNVTIVKLGLNRVDKFKRDFPKAVTAKELLQQVMDNLGKQLGKETLEAYAIQQDSTARYLERLDVSKVLDPKLKNAIKLVKRDVKAKIEPILNLQRRGLTYYVKSPLNGDEKPIDMDASYPLLEAEHLYRADPKMLKHIYIYVNAAYKAAV